MRYLLVKTENMPILALALGSLDYKAGNSPIFLLHLENSQF